MKCRWCSETTAGLCYKHLTEQQQRDAAHRRWVIGTCKLIFTICFIWAAWKWASW